MLKGLNSYTIGSEFAFIYFKLITIFFRVLKVIGMPRYKKLVWKAYESQPVKIVYYFIYELFMYPIDQFTVIKSEILLTKKEKTEKIKQNRIYLIF